MIRLTLLGPAFGCPSIDAQSNAAVALLQSWAQQSDEPFELVRADEDYGNLPRLQHKGKDRRGFRAIVRYLVSIGARIELDESIAAFIESRGQPLLDVFHYVSHENYAAQTRPAFTKILPWHANYTLPPQQRQAARRRTEHLGISGIDLDDVHGSVIDRSSDSVSVAERKWDDPTEKRAQHLLGRKRTVTSFLRQPSHAGAFKLKNLADAFYEPLDAELGDKPFFGSGDELSATDCLVWGYLSLLLAPNMPQSWAADILRAKFLRLEKYVARVGERLHVDADSLQRLPWVTTPSRDIFASLQQVGRGLLAALPGLPEVQPVIESNKASTVSVERYLPHTLSTVAATSALSAYILFRNGIWPTGQEVHVFGGRRLPAFATPASALSVLDALY